MGEEMPAEEATGEEAPAEEAMSAEDPVEEAIAEEAPAEEAIAEEAPAEEADSEEAPSFSDELDALWFQYDNCPTSAPHDCHMMQWWFRFLRPWSGPPPPARVFRSQMLQ